MRDAPWRAGVGMLALVLVAPALAADAPVSPSRKSKLLWSGDYQTANFKQWYRMQAVPGGATIVTSPVHNARYAARYRVRSGDNPIRSTGERAEARASAKQTGGRPGREYWYAWSTLFPADASLPPSTQSWNIFTQWHQTRRDGCPPNIALQADTSHTPPSIKLRIRGGATHECRPQYDVVRRPVPLQLGHWYDFVVHIKWSDRRSAGFVEAWVDGVKVVPRTETATLYTGQGAYLKQGFYRASSPLTTTVYHVGPRVGSSHRAVTRRAR